MFRISRRRIIKYERPVQIEYTVRRNRRIRLFGPRPDIFSIRIEPCRPAARIFSVKRVRISALADLIATVTEKNIQIGIYVAAVGLLRQIHNPVRDINFICGDKISVIACNKPRGIPLRFCRKTARIGFIDQNSRREPLQEIVIFLVRVCDMPVRIQSVIYIFLIGRAVPAELHVIDILRTTGRRGAVEVHDRIRADLNGEIHSVVRALPVQLHIIFIRAVRVFERMTSVFIFRNHAVHTVFCNRAFNAADGYNACVCSVIRTLADLTDGQTPTAVVRVTVLGIRGINRVLICFMIVEVDDEHTDVNTRIGKIFRRKICCRVTEVSVQNRADRHQTFQRIFIRARLSRNLGNGAARVRSAGVSVHIHTEVRSARTFCASVLSAELEADPVRE